MTGIAAGIAAREAFGPSADAHRLVRLANEGDATAREILAEIGRYLGSGMGSFVNAFGPELIVIGGGFGVAAWEHLLPTALEVHAAGGPAADARDRPRRAAPSSAPPPV